MVISRRIATLVVAMAACRPAATSESPRRSGAPVAAPEVDAAYLHAALEHLAADASRGRYTLEPEDIGRAADYLADQYREMGVAGVAGVAGVTADYRVPFDVAAGTRASEALNVWLDTEGQPFALEEGDAVAIANGGGVAVIESSVLVTASTPPSKAAGKVAITFVTRDDPTAIAARVEALRAAEAAGAMFVLPAATSLPDPAPFRAAIGDASMPAALVRHEAVSSFRVEGEPFAALAKASKFRELPRVQISMAARREDVMTQAPNVVAYVPGGDLAREIVVLGAHYDHIGTVERGHMCRPGVHADGSTDQVCNGADDNASGTVAVLAVARAIAAAKIRPRRTIVFAHFAGEELGLHGSKALATKPPDAVPFSGARVVAMVNLDMIGRLGAAGLSIGALGSSDAWTEILAEAGDHGMDIVYERAVTARSDHASYYRRDVPVLFFFTGLHDDYHGPGDETAKINFEGMTTITQLVLEVTLAAADGRPMTFTDPRSPREGIVGRLPGSDPQTVVEIPGQP